MGRASDDPEDLVDLRNVLEQEFLRKLRTEMDALDFSAEVRVSFARKVIAKAERVAKTPTRDAVTVAFFSHVERERTAMGAFMTNLRDEVRAPLETRFLSLLEQELDALYWPLDERQKLAQRTVRWVIREAWRTDTPIEEAFRERVQADRLEMRQSIEDSEVERRERGEGPLSEDGRGSLQRIAEYARTQMSLQWDFVESMRDAFDRAEVPPLEREEIARWLLALIRGKFEANSPEALRNAFAYQMGLEDAAWRFVRDPANRGRQSTELDTVRSDFEVLYASAVAKALGGKPEDTGLVDDWAARAIHGAERAVAENPWLHLHVAFYLQVAADTASPEKFVLKDESDPSAAPTPSAPMPLASSNPSDLDLKRQAADLLVEASRLEKAGDYDRADRLLNRARRTSLGIDDSPGVARAHLARARLERLRGRFLGARKEYRLALELYRKLDQPRTVTMIETELGRLPE